MKSIEERAKEFAQNFEFVEKDMDCGNCNNCRKCKDYRKYVDIVTEQKAIDIDKVCDWLMNYFVFEHEAMTAAGCDVFLCKLRKAMEE